MNERLDLLCLGEALIDFVATDVGPLRRAPGFVKAAGGAPANVAVAAAKLGLRSGFMGAVGRDEFGYFLRDTFAAAGVDVRALCHSEEGGTPLAFVSLKKNAQRDFLFYWTDTADQRIDVREMPVSLAGSSRAFHYGSIGLIHPPMRKATQECLRAAKCARDVFISCDPNVRLGLWPDAKHARKKILDAIAPAHLVKINDDELRFLVGRRDLSAGMRALADYTDAGILVTLGERGAAYRWQGTEGIVPGFRVASIDSTGAGDGFVAGFLTRMLTSTEDPVKLRGAPPGLEEWIRYANAVGALATTKRGAIPSFPSAIAVAKALRTLQSGGGLKKAGVLPSSP